MPGFFFPGRDGLVEQGEDGEHDVRGDVFPDGAQDLDAAAMQELAAREGAGGQDEFCALTVTSRGVPADRSWQASEAAFRFPSMVTNRMARSSGRMATLAS